MTPAPRNFPLAVSTKVTEHLLLNDRQGPWLEDLRVVRCLVELRKKRATRKASAKKKPSGKKALQATVIELAKTLQGVDLQKAIAALLGGGEADGENDTRGSACSAGGSSSGNAESSEESIKEDGGGLSADSA